MDISFEESPIFMTRLVDDSGWSMTGGPMPTGSRVAASWRRSCTSWRAWTISVPCLKMRTIEDIAITVLDLMVAISGVALSVSSMGTVINSSTSWVVIPMPSVWISTRGGANSGKTSTGRSETRPNPRANMAAEMATTRYRNLRLEPMIQRNISGTPSQRSNGHLENRLPAR
jgi:hypothetical protein